MLVRRAQLKEGREGERKRGGGVQVGQVGKSAGRIRIINFVGWERSKMLMARTRTLTYPPAARKAAPARLTIEQSECLGAWHGTMASSDIHEVVNIHEVVDIPCPVGCGLWAVGCGLWAVGH